MAKYIMQEMPDMQGKGKQIKYPRMLIEGTVDLHSIAERIARNTTFAVGEVEAVVGMVAQEVGRVIAEGYCLKIEGIGAFSAKLGLKKGAEREAEEGGKRNAQSIEISNVHFQPDKRLLSIANSYCELQRSKGKTYSRPNVDLEKRLVLVHDFLKNKPFLRLRDYVLLTGVSLTTASVELRKFAAQGLLAVEGKGTHSVYVLP